MFDNLLANSFDAREATALLLVIATVRWHYVMRNRSLEEVLAGLGAKAKCACMTAVLLAMYLCSGGNSSAFIYFQF